MPESIACMPEAQLRITVQPGTFWPQPMRSAATRPMLTSSTEGAAQPRMTSLELGRREGLAREQGAAGLRGEVAGGERPGAVLGFQERRARAVDDVDGLLVHSYGMKVRLPWLLRVLVPQSFSSISARPKSCGKSSTLITCLRSASLRCHCTSSSAVQRRTCGSPIALLARLAQLLGRSARRRWRRRRPPRASPVASPRPWDVHAVGQAVARRARLQRDPRALAVARVERRAERHAEREDGPAQQPGERLHREVGEDAVERLLRVVQRVAHRPAHQRQVGLDAPLVLVALQRRRDQVHHRQHVAQAAGDLLLALQRPAHRQHRDVGEEGERRGEARNVAVVVPRLRRALARNRSERGPRVRP